MDSEELFVNVTPETFFSANSFLASRAVSVAINTFNGQGSQHKFWIGLLAC